MIVPFRVVGKLKAIWPDLIPELKAPSFILVDSEELESVSKRDNYMYVVYSCRPDEALDLLVNYAIQHEDKELQQYVEKQWKQRCREIDNNPR